MAPPDGSPATITLHHPAGKMEVVIDYAIRDGSFVLASAGVVRTARKLAQGSMFVPKTVWAG